MIRLTRDINWNTILEINNSSINLVYKKWNLFLSKKDIWELFGVKKSIIKEILNDLNIKNNANNYDKSKDKNIKLYSLESILLIWYKLKKYNETKIIIKSNRIIKNTYLNNSTILEIFKNKYLEIKNKIKILELI